MLDLSAVGHISDILLESAPLSVAIFDFELNLITCNSRYIEEFGLDKREIRQSHINDIHPGLPERFHVIHRRVLSGESLSSEADLLPCPGKPPKWIEWKLVPWRDRSGAVGGLISFLRGIDDLATLQKREQEYHATLDLMIDSATNYAIAMLDRTGTFTFWSAGAERIFGWNDREMIGQSGERLIPAELLGNATPSDLLLETTKAGIHRSRISMLRKSGEHFAANVSASRIRAETGQEIGYALVICDVTTDLEKEHALAANTAQIKAILSTVPDAMITMNPEGVIESFSTTAEALFGYSAAEVLGRNFTTLLPETQHSRHARFMDSYREAGRSGIAPPRFIGRRKDGSIFPYEFFVGEAASNGQRIFTGFIRDLTQREAAEVRFRELQVKLGHISRITTAQTMAMALAHEINQPLTAIANYMQAASRLVSSGEHPEPEVAYALEQSGREAIRAGTIVQHLREFVSREELKYDKVAVDVLVDQACALGFMGCDSGNIICSTEVAHGIDDLTVDSIQIQQVLINLIRNAVLAVGTKGRIAVKVHADADGTIFSVIDDGPGVPTERLGSLFDPFVTFGRDGMGLGLAICRSIVELHGGLLWYEPAEGGGASFHFTIPRMEELDACEC